VGAPNWAAEPPILVLLGSRRYWELCRKREAQKGAAWIKELQRLAKEIEEAIGVTVIYLGLALEGDPGEQTNVAAQNPPTLAGLSADIEEWKARDLPDELPSQTLDPQTREELRALGYLVE